MTQRDTICALASALGRAGVAVIRISGPGAGDALRALCGPPPPPRQASLRKVRNPGTGEVLDRGLALWLPGPASFTGEDIAELHIHGGRAVTGRVIDALTSLRGMRLAEPGEFARRAFENGRIDLTEVEGLADLIAAETEAQARQAIAQAEGGARALYESWREDLVKAQALAEAGLDFADEADVAADAAVQADAAIAKLVATMSKHLADRRGERLRDGFRVVIAGPPNVGKSSLLNALARRDAAIVSEEAGTTRDVIEVHLDLRGLPVIVTDTAGIRAAQGAVEAEGIRRTLQRVEDADLVLWMVDATADRNSATEAPTIVDNSRQITVLNKIDLVKSLQIAGGVALSAKTCEGVAELVDLLSKYADEGLAAGEPAVITRARHRAELEAATEALQRFRAERGGPEIKAEELRIAARHLGRLTGRIDVEEVLGAIFSEFCIGK
ncbi:MAG TPA: tRNA uridine-5-carboxymethylaminomethyl(34) synthesis GTPase MnmE [Methyloceanibacter sp.]|jgi:tRNA modification GTPase|nr:tRNA uridine-5-carboxymethylaminomethyl(34) synthesis GTPase MnmE [Methyloceanibacter sp.]